MTNQLKIRRENWPDVTETPRYIVELTYEGCSIGHDDIYIDDADIPAQLEMLEATRKGDVKLDGGSRFSCTVSATSRGGLHLSFRITQGPGFPGKLAIEGYFSIDGEYAGSAIRSLIGLFRQGADFVI